MDKCRRAVELLDRMGRITHGLQFALGLNPAQWEALRFLSRANRYSRSPGALAEFLGTTKGTASQTLIALEAKGLVTRRRRASDRRSVDLELTPAGAALIEKDPMGLVAQAVSRLGEDECEAMSVALGRLAETLQQAIGLPAFGPCLDCANFCVERDGAEAPVVCRCALNEDVLASQELDRVCASFQPVA